MKQIYLQSYFKSGYNRFMQYVNNVLEHPQRIIIEKRVEIIKFYDEFGARATRKAFRKGRSTIYLWKQTSLSPINTASYYSLINVK